MTPRRAATLATLLVLLAASAARAYPLPGRTFRISVTSAGAEADNNSGGVVLTPDGRTVAFASLAGLVPEDTNGVWDTYVRDLTTGALERVSVASDGTQKSSESFTVSAIPSISEDGRLVAFESGATNLVPGDTNGVDDVFVHDRITGETQRVSVSATGAQAAAHSQYGNLSGNGRYVFFFSEDDTLVPNDQSPYIDIFRRDLQTNALELVSKDSQGNQSVFDPSSFSINRAGTVIAWAAISPTYQVPDTNGPVSDVFVRDLTTGMTRRVSEAPDGAPADGNSVNPSLSADGRFVAFGSLADNLVPDDSNGWVDVFVYDRVAQRTERVSVPSSGAQSLQGGGTPVISPDGRFVAFNGVNADLAPDPDGNAGTDVYVHDLLTGATSVASLKEGEDKTGNQIAYSPAISADGRLVGFQSSADDLVANDLNEHQDAFIRDRGPSTGIGALTASPAGSVSGRARFAGTVSEASDPPADGTVQSGPLALELVGARVVWRPEENDLYVREDLRSLPGAGRTGTVGVPGAHYIVSFTVSGVVHQVRSDITADARPTVWLWRCAPTCTQTTALTGGVGRIGASMTASVPLSLLGVTPGDGAALTNVVASTTFTGPLVSAQGDSVTLPNLALDVPRVTLGVAPPGTPEQEVAFGPGAPLSDGAFAASLGALPPGEHDVWARACLGTACGSASTRIAA